MSRQRKSVRTRRHKAPSLFAFAVVMAASRAFAAADYWITGSGEWTNSANWLIAPAPNAADSLAIFQTAAATSPTVITVAAPVTIGGMVLDAATSYRFDAVGTGSFALASSAGPATLFMNSGTGASTLTLGVNFSNAVAVTNNATTILALTGAITGSGDLLLNGRGEVDLRGSSNSWTPANIFINAGTLVAANIAALGSLSTGAVEVANGAQFDISGITSTSTTSQFTKTVILGGTGVPPAQATLASVNGSGSNNTLMGAVVLNGGGIFNPRVSNAVINIGDPNGVFGGASLSGTGPLIKVGTGSLNINVQAGFTGGTSVTAGTVTVTTVGSLVGTGDVGVYNGGRLNVFKPAGNSAASASVSPNAVVLSGGILGIEADISLANFLSAASTTGVVSLETGGTVTLGGTNVLDLSGVAADAIVRIGGAGPSGGNGTTTLAPAVSLIPDALHTLHFGGIKGTLVLANAIADIAGIPTNVEMSTGLQTLILTGNSTYTGTTTINSNIAVNINSANALGSAAAPTFINGGTVSTLIGMAIAEPFTLNGGLLSVNGPSSGAITVNGGTLSLTQAGTSPLTIKGGLTTLNAPWSAPIAQSGGSLTITAAAAGSTGSLTLSGGIVNVNVSANINMPMLLTGGTVNLSEASSGKIVIAPGGLLRQISGAFISDHSVRMTGGQLNLTANVTLETLLDAASTGGLINFESTVFLTDGGVGSFDFTAFPGGSGLSLTTTTSNTIPASEVLTPDNTTHTLRFGGAGTNGTLTINAPIVDHNGVPTKLNIAAGLYVALNATSNYTSTSIINGTAELIDPSALGAADGTDATGTVIGAAGILKSTLGLGIGNEKITMNGGTLSLKTAGPVVLNGPSTLLGTFNGPISGTATLSLPGAATLAAANTYTGLTTVTGTVTVNAASALGTAAQGTVIQAGILTMNATSNEAFTLTAGTFNQNASASGPITVNGGILNENGLAGAPITVNGGIVNLKGLFAGSIGLTGGSLMLSNVSSAASVNMTGGWIGGTGTLTSAVTYLGTTTLGLGSSKLTLAGGVSGTGTLKLGDYVNVSPQPQLTVGPDLTVNGDLIVQVLNGTFTATGNVNVSGSTTIVNNTVTSINGTAHFATVSIQAGASLSKIAAGTLQFANVANDGALVLSAGASSAAGISGNGTTNLGSDAALSVARISQQLLSMDAGAKLTLATPSSASRLNSLTLDPTAVVDLVSNGLIVEASGSIDKNTKINALNAALISARQAGAWLGTGITSSAAAADSSHYAVGMFDNALLGYVDFAGGTGNADGNSILVIQALLGDANFDGHVDAADLAVVANNFNHPANNWAAGDLNYDGYVDNLDVALIVNHWDAGSAYTPIISFSPGFSFTLTTTPEPASLGLLVAGAGALLARRRAQTR